MPSRIFSLSFLLISLLSKHGHTQEQPEHITLLPPTQIDHLIHEVSGATAMSHVVELGGYHHDRHKAEYESTYRESKYIVRMAEEYNLSDAHIETFPQEQWAWDAEQAELWLVKPERRLIIRYRDNPAALATGSWNGEVTTEVVYAGTGTDPSHYEGIDVKGKLVLVSGPVSRAHRLAVRTYDAAGVLSFYNGVRRTIDVPDQIAWQDLGSRTGGDSDLPYDATFGFSLSHRMGMELLELIEGGESVELQVLVRTRTFPADLEVPTAAIPGNGSSDQEIALSAYLFEGNPRQAATDKLSGSAAILEAARALNALIGKGKLARPRRTIRLIWEPELSGTHAYLERFPEERRRMIAAINVDRIGARLNRNGTSLQLYRNPSSMASFVDDVTQVFFEYVGDTNREKDNYNNRAITQIYTKPILDPTGSRDPFYYNIESYYGAPNRALFNGPRFKIPAVLFKNWPDASGGRLHDLDPTQLKRGAFLIAATAWYLANLSPKDVPRLATRMAAMGTRRIDDNLIRQLSSLSTAPSDELGNQFKEARIFLSEAYKREERNLSSLQVFTDPNSEPAKQITSISREMAGRESSDQNRLKNHFNRLTKDALLPVKIPPESDDEKIAAKLVPVLAPTTVDIAKSLTTRVRYALGGGIRSTDMTDVLTTEYRNLTNGRRSVLEIRNAASAAFGAIELRKVMRYFYDLEEKGQVFLRRN